MEIKNVMFQDLESFGKERGFSEWPWKSFGFLLGKILEMFLNGCAFFSKAHPLRNISRIFPSKNPKLFQGHNMLR